MQKIIACIISFWVLAVGAQPQQHLTLQPKTNLWVINEKTRIGATDRVKAQMQNPYPFCFSAAAAILWDQHRCSVDNKKCSEEKQTSFLAITPAGQKLPPNEISLTDGGYPELSLLSLVNEGFTSLENCSYSTNSSFNGNEIIIETARKNWRKHKDYSPYLARAYRRQVIQAISTLSIPTPENKADEVLNSTLTGNKLIGNLFLGPSCLIKEKDDRFKVKIHRIDDNIKPIATIIDQQLSKNLPVMVSFCTTYTQPLSACVTRHTAVIVAKAKARHIVTGDIRTYYWVVNTWGEEWQERNADGWVAADQLYSGILNEVIWLEKK